MNVLDRFLGYVKYDTQSDELTNLTPSTPGQMVFAQALEKELKNAINDIKGNGLHTKSPACLKYLRERIFKSIAIYQKYLN